MSRIIDRRTLKQNMIITTKDSEAEKTELQTITAAKSYCKYQNQAFE